MLNCISRRGENDDKKQKKIVTKITEGISDFDFQDENHLVLSRLQRYTDFIRHYTARPYIINPLHNRIKEVTMAGF